MIFVPVMIWICLALQAPKWCFILIYVGFALRLLEIFFRFSKNMYEKGKEAQKNGD